MGGGDFDALRVLLERSQHYERRVAGAPPAADVAGVQRHVSRVPARVERTAAWPDWADPELAAGWRKLGVNRPWTHQVAAADFAFAGKTTLLATATGSGKSLSYWLPALTAARLPRGQGFGKTLYLAPTKALAGDQLQSAREDRKSTRLNSSHVTTVDEIGR